ncbi:MULTISPECIES: TetR/AcrR family transcriptional regulator [unclassified Nocardioides]|uniref:TetR/AcrR family transcriptional regulator n=1 Tax=unclassified Nocardioides TaxID=2615069 RepID=UPI001154CB87|nr:MULTISPECIES: TetR/AcrR family transcriptional regulator [unclassified Nocardioides]TQK71778.1 TetR family transcriptional regulator [Nocardioides sp. SLBN-35]WGY04041.1 TetR/AcrR family transcriptional regulator [Nocardioides sp. QY071]
MPRLVDHDERRRAIIAAAWRLLATRGVDGVNMRDLAAEAGYTNGALSHYFAGKDEILRTSYEHVLDATNQRIEASVGHRTGLSALRRLCHEVMPLTAEARLEARIAMSLWQRAMGDAAMAELNNAAVAEWKQQMARHWQEAIDAGELPAAAVPAGVELLMTTIIGLQVTAVLDPATTSRAAQVALVDGILGQFTPRE